MSFGETFNIGGIVASVSNPTVTNVTSASGNEGTSLVHTVTLSAATTTSTNYTYSLSGGTATAGVDYTVPPTFSNGVTLSGSLTVPTAVSSFTVTVAAISDGSSESSETYNLTIGGITGVGTISDAGASDITPNVVINNGGSTTGVAPFAVHFDLSGTTSSNTTRPFHEIAYGHSFADAGSGTWGYGARAGVASRNSATGPITAHVFETPGTYVVNHYFNDGTTTTTTTSTITVTDPDSYWAGAKTICVGNVLPVAGVGGVPSGATCVASSNAVTAISANIGSGDCRILFKRGDTFTMASGISITQQGAGMVGAFGTGAKPILDITGASGFTLSGSGTPTLSNWRFADLDIDGNDSDAAAFTGGGSFNKFLFLRCDTHNIKYGYNFAPSVLNLLNDPTYTHPEFSNLVWQDVTVVDLVGLANGSCCMYAGAESSAILGGFFNPNNKGEHGIRMPHESNTVVSHNDVTGVPSGRAFISLRSPDQGQATYPSGTYGTYVYSEKVYVSDNYTYGGFTTGMNGIGPTNSSATGRHRDVIWERNRMVGSDTTTECLGISGVDVTVRNNLFTITSSSAIGATPLSNSPVPDGLWVYNNSVYASGTSGRLFSIIQNQTGDMTACVFEMKNNILYGPSTSNGTSIFLNLVGATINTGGNSADNQRTTSPLFTTTPPVAGADFKITTGSYAIGLGVSVPVWEDYDGVVLSGTRDAGAIRH